MKRPQSFWEKVALVGAGPDDCWEWQGAVVRGRRNGKEMDRVGYGHFWHEGKQQLAHRVSYQLEHGPIPDAQQVHHTCENTLCVNPAHLELKTPKEHVAASTLHPAQRTHCPQGHLYDDENTYVDKTGRRHCRACRRARSADWYEAHSGYWKARYQEQKIAETQRG